jgi:uncharacterized RDD family membrane protein YckC
MDENNITLDQSLVEAEVPNAPLSLANGWKRFTNLIIDTICYYALVFGFFLLMAFIGFQDVLENKAAIYFFVFLINFLYYSIFETYLGKTIGKMITRTRVVTESGDKIDFRTAAARSVSRFIPFEAFSFLGGQAVGLHDKLAHTRVINVAKPD